MSSVVRDITTGHTKFTCPPLTTPIVRHVYNKLIFVAFLCSVASTVTWTTAAIPRTCRRSVQTSPAYSSWTTPQWPTDNFRVGICLCQRLHRRRQLTVHILSLSHAVMCHYVGLHSPHHSHNFCLQCPCRHNNA